MVNEVLLKGLNNHYMEESKVNNRCCLNTSRILLSGLKPRREAESF